MLVRTENSNVMIICVSVCVRARARVRMSICMNVMHTFDEPNGYYVNIVKQHLSSGFTLTRLYHKRHIMVNDLVQWLLCFCTFIVFLCLYDFFCCCFALFCFVLPFTFYQHGNILHGHINECKQFAFDFCFCCSQSKCNLHAMEINNNNNKNSGNNKMNTAAHRRKKNQQNINEANSFGEYVLGWTNVFILLDRFRT